MKNKKILISALSEHSNKIIENDGLNEIINNIIQKHNMVDQKKDITEFINKYITTIDNNKIVIITDKKSKQEKNDIVKELVDKYSNLYVKSDNVVEEEHKIVSEDSYSADTDELEREIEAYMNGSNKKGYVYPEETLCKLKKTEPKYGPYGTQWIHDKQVDDVLDIEAKRRLKIFNELVKIPIDEQCSEAWFKARESRITASDIGTVLGDNKHSDAYEFIMKKVAGGGFPGNEFTYHGKKYEKIATMIYEYRMNVCVHEFGLIGHPEHYFLGASPDGIINEYKNNGINKTKHVGRMLEIKCPFIRKINTEGEIKDHICPIYYWDQVQLQLECCDLDECDFWQCNIYEYRSREKFMQDTDLNEPFRSKETGFEKGCLIQLIKKVKAGDSMNNYNETVYNNSSFVYPDKVEMSPYDIDRWIADKLEEIRYKDQYKEYYVDRIVYWRLNNSHSCTIIREKEWFKERLENMKKVWNYVEFFRENPNLFKLLEQYVNSMARKNKTDIMNKIEELYKSHLDGDGTIVQNNMLNHIKKNSIPKDKKPIIKKTSENLKNKNFENYLF